ncbi:porin [Pseudoroseicyclus aestuarii]|uniref:Porin-like protein n=1 Tax=Pseudoroseicyclus aestuarii TaxID=1795041 RepID=A0A318SP67_9RHOB|nr:porin [Pseudoroseicyclus aestuarii]PYE83671.1 porin-like protein [Pseudoroseicyclus aestuarii]
MKRILLASASIVAFAGAAAAEVDISGSAAIGWNDDFKEIDTGEEGFYNDFDFDFNFTQELDNGLTAAVRIGFEYVDSDTGTIDNGHDDFGSFTDDNFLLSLTADMGAMYFGDTSFAAETYWNGVTNMAADDFSEADGEVVLRGEFTWNDITFGTSWLIHNDQVAGESATGVGLGTGNIDQGSIGAQGEFGGFTFSAAYQEEADESYGAGYNGDFVEDEVFGLAVGTTFRGFDVTLAYADHDGEGSSTGLEATFPVGPVSLTAFYVLNDEDGAADYDDNYGLEVAYASGPFALSARYHDGADEEMGVEGSYTIGNGLMAYAGYVDEGDAADGSDQSSYYYVAGELDLGNGASLLLSYADVDDVATADTDLDEIGVNDYLLGTTLQVSFDF